MTVPSFLKPYLRYVLTLVYAMPFMFFMNGWQRWLMFVAGLYLGIAFLYVDEKWLNSFYEEQGHPQYPKLITRSTLFLLAFVPLAIFVLTSAGSLLGTGMVLGIEVGLLEEMWRYRHIMMSDERGTYSIFQWRFFHDLKNRLNLKEIDQVVWVTVGFLLVSSILAII